MGVAVKTTTNKTYALIANGICLFLLQKSKSKEALLIL